MVSFLDPPLKPRDGRRLKILAVCRISTVHQDERSLADQEALYRQWVGDRTDVPYNLEVIASQGSGESLDRAAYLDATASVETSTFDLVIAEDLGRICRRVHAYLFCENCEDHDTRVIAINDHVDTARDDWRLGSFFAVMRHESYNKDTSARIRRSLRNRFQQGGVFQIPVYGYLKPAGAKSDADVSKDPAAEPILEEWFRKLETGASYAEIADWLNEQEIATGRYCRQKQWNGTMVGRITHNPILKGVRQRNNKMSRRINKTGHRRSVNAPPEERLERRCPHLAFFDAPYYDRVIRTTDQSNSIYRRKRPNGVDPRAGISKKRTVWPGQHVYCGICGRLFVYGGHGQKEHLMCMGAREHHCWNGVTVDGPLAARKMVTAIRAEIATLPDFDAILVQMLREEPGLFVGMQDGRKDRLSRKLEKVRRELGNVSAAIRELGHSRSLLEDLKKLESEEDQVRAELADLETPPAPPMEFPSTDEIKQAASEALDDLAMKSPEFGRLMKRVIPRITVFPVRLCDDGDVELRARFTLNLTSLRPHPLSSESSEGIFQRELVVDLFDPPQREEFRQRVVELTAQRMKQRDVAAQLGITQTAVQRAVALDRKMKALGLTEPYLAVTAPPTDCARLRRHRHPRYCFRPLDDQDRSAVSP